MSVRCRSCGTVLIHEAIGHSAAYKKAVRILDARMYSGIGGLAGFFAVAVALKFVFTQHWLSDAEIVSAAGLSAAVGAFAGALLARAKHHL
jgi:hypothetical protein